MTGVEDGMLSLAAKSLKGERWIHNPGHDTTTTTSDELIPMEPSLATEGTLWFDNLIAPDPSLILPFALSGIMFLLYRYGGNTYGLLEVLIPGQTIDRARQILYWNLQKTKILKIGALAIAPATLMFPSGMLLYWISSSLAGLFVGPRRFLVFFRISPGGTTEEDKYESKQPKKQQFRGPTMQDLRNQKRTK